MLTESGVGKLIEGGVEEAGREDTEPSPWRPLETREGGEPEICLKRSPETVAGFPKEMVSPLKVGSAKLSRPV
jgi:hypothetical protein